MCEDAQVHWDDLRHVLALARDRTLSKASDRVGATHTTVGRRLKAIEADLGVRLFDQTPEGYVPTAAGQEVVEVAERVELELLGLEARVVGGDARLQGKLRVATLDLLFRRFAPAFRSFIARYPLVELTVTASDTEVSLTRREADVALRLTNTPPEHLVGRRLGQVEFAVYASTDLAARVGPGATYADFPWLHWDERLNPRWLDQWLATNAPGAAIAVRVDFSSLSLFDAVRAGLGVHFLPCVEGDADPSLVRIGPPEGASVRGLWLLTLPELRHTSRVRAFLEHMGDAFVGRGG